MELVCYSSKHMLVYVYFTTCTYMYSTCTYNLEMLLLSLLVETGQFPSAGLTQADKTCIQLNFYLEILKEGQSRNAIIIFIS